MITQATIDKIFEATRVEEVIGDFVQLKKAGSNLKGLSPFSSEKSPSFMVSPVKQIWKDFSSGKGGNAISFIMEHEHFTYPEALRYLAKKYNIEVEETQQTNEQLEQANEKESMYLVSEFANQYFQNILLNHDEGKAIGYTYFKERGFTDETIKKFGLGYSPDQWDAFTNEALTKGYNLNFLEKTGLTIVKEDKKFDRFKARVMFPIQSLSGRVLGFGGRILTSDKKAAKYLNSPESEIYHKSKVLYGIFQAKQAIAKQDNCYLVEGYTDVIQFNQSGIENVVASSGTALTPDQIRLINRLTNNVTVLYDGDAAGLRASIRGIDLILEQGMDVRVCTFPEGEDPDSFAKKSSFEELKNYLESNTTDFIQFKANLLIQEAQNDPIKKANLINDMIVSISKIPDAIKREVYVQECARIMDVSETVIYNSLAQLVAVDVTKANKKFVEEERKKTFEVIKNESTVKGLQNQDIIAELEHKIIEILLNFGFTEEVFTEENYIVKENGEYEEVITKEARKVYHKVNLYFEYDKDLIEFTNPKYKEIYYKLIEHFRLLENKEAQQFDLASFLSNQDPEITQIVSNISFENHATRLHDWNKKMIDVKTKEMTIAQYVTETMLTLNWVWMAKIASDLYKSLSNSVEITEDIKHQIQDFNLLKTTLSRKLNRVYVVYNN
nr:DNA primase [uncultured Flavobacterium sp.]